METPALSSATVTDVHLGSIACTLGSRRRAFLQTSPEFHMKRLLAAGSGPIYQLCRAFRDGESGPLHNPEFTLLEWYRPGFDHHALMGEVEELLGMLLGTAAGRRVTYRDAFLEACGLDPHRATAAELRHRVRELGLELSADLGSGEEARDDWLALLLTHAVEPTLSREAPTFLYDFPATQAALARVRPGSPPVAERFEVYCRGVEIANGYRELRDPEEQRSRFEADSLRRRRRGLPDVAPDERLLAALESGLPECAGVALGVDRVVMLAAGATRIDAVTAFPIHRA